MMVHVLEATCLGVLLVMLIYTLRHLLFAMNRLFCPHRIDYTDLAGFHLPSVSILIPMHNEEAVAPDVLEALLESDYPHDPGGFEIIPIDDHSTDGTGEILDDYARRYSCIQPLHLRIGNRGKAAALTAATRIAKGEVLILFDADYVPGKSLLKFLVAPFADPEVGAVMGRVVPHNVGSSLLTRLLDLERSGGYQISQQARYNLGLIAQYGGTAGGVRRAALDAVGDAEGVWRASSLTEDTDLTLRLAIHGWKIAYVNRAECYEEAPATWEVRRKQIERWAIGHTDCLHRHIGALLRSPYLSARAKLDGVLLLCVYLTAPLIVIGWLASVALFFSGRAFLPTLTTFFLAGACYNALGNFASFFEIGSSVILDGARQRIRLLPLNIVNFIFSTATVSRALGKYYGGRILGRHFPWNKTLRFRHGGGNGDGDHGPNGYGNERGLNFIRAKAAVSGSTI
jgi:cellulose synthase/poly-beta-1,6-N-acetylglucosamine synthase-like glycosyltransferase